MTTQIKAGVIAANAVNSSELASGALSGQNFTGDVIFSGTTQGTRLGLGVAPHATAPLNITTTNQHIRLNNGSELGIVHVLSTGELELWGHGDGESINFRTGSGAGTVAMNIIGNNVGITNTSTLNANLHIGSAAATGDATNPALQIGGASTYRLGLYTDSEGAVIANANGDDGIQFVVKTAGEAMRIDGGTGNVGIGTNSPNALLHIKTEDPATNQAVIDFRNPTYGIFAQTNSISSRGNTLEFIASDYNNNSATTHSVLTLRPEGNVGIGTSSPAEKLHIRDSSTNADVYIKIANDSRDWFMGVEGSNSDILSFKTHDASNLLNITSSGNVGIGTSSPAEKLHVNSGTGNVPALFQSSDALALITFKDNNTSTDVGVGALGNDQVFYAGSERMRIDSSGNVQIGTSNPSGNKGITIQAGTNSSASLRLKNDAHDWDVNCQTNDKFAIYSHTAGTERLVIDTSGNVGVGTTAPQNTLHIYGTGQTTANLAESGNQGGMLRITDANTGAGAGGAILFANYHADNNSSMGMAAIKGILNNGSTYTQGSLAFSTRNSINGTSMTERMRISYNGNVGVGTNNPLQKFTVSGSIWASGYYITNLQGNAQLTSASTSSGSNPSYIGQGLITVTISDAKAKENFGSVETNECLNKIVSLSEHVKKFDWIDEDWKKEKGRTVGMVAQEIYEDHSEFVHKPENYDDDGWAIRYQEIVPTLVKAIQEQQTIIDDLKSRITKLEG